MACAAALRVVSLRREAGAVRIEEHGNCRRLGHKLPQQLQSLRPELGGEKDDARDVATRTVEAVDETLPDRVTPGAEGDRHARGCGLDRDRRDGVPDDHGQRPAKQISHQSRQPIHLVVCVAIFDRDVLALNEPQFLQTLAERGHEVHRRGERRATEKSDQRHCRRLRPRRAATRLPRRRIAR